MNSNNINEIEEVFHKPYIMLCLQWEEDLTSFEGYKVIDDIANSKSGRPLIIISTGFSGQAATFLSSHEYKGVRIQALIAPGKDDFDKADIMNDIAECIGTMIIGKYLEAPPEGIGMYICGEAELVKINQDWDGHSSYNLIYKGKDPSYSIEGRIDEIKEELPDPDNKFYDEEDEAYYNELMERINSFSVEESNYKFKYVDNTEVHGHAAPS
jgi:hypothetical protein